MSERGTVETGWRWTCLAVACALGLFIMPSAGHALSQTSVAIMGRTSWCTGGEVVPNGTGQLGAGPVFISDTRTDVIHGSTITMTASADYGSLRAMAFADKPELPCPSESRASPRDDAIAYATATFDDVFTVVGPPGLIGIRFTSTLSGFCSPDQFQVSGAQCAGVLQTNVGGVLGFQQDSRNHVPPTEAGFVTVGSGAVLNIHVMLQTFASASSDSDDRISTTADFFNTGTLYADVLTPGASFVAASGHNYSTLVPEPSTLALLGLGMLGLGAVRHRRVGRREFRLRFFDWV